MKTTLMHLREICKNNLASLLLNLIIEFLIRALKIVEIHILPHESFVPIGYICEFYP
jgi:hypothetical protein